MKKNVFSFNSELYKVTGVQKVLMDIHEAIREEYNAKIVGTIPFDKVHKDLKITKSEYIRFINPFMFRNSIVIVHERRFLPLFWVLNHILFQKIKLVYIHHNIFNNHRWLSLMPKNVVAISEEGVRNLETYFKVPNRNIHKIYNAVKNIDPPVHDFYHGKYVKILYPARINGIKRQLDIIHHLKGKIQNNIKIFFAGSGPQASQLEREVVGSPNFEYLGYRSDIFHLLHICDYMMLFSKQEGLPITLIEATMIGTPIICNNVGGNTEIVNNGKNGFVLNTDDWDGLIRILNKLPLVSENKYLGMSIQGQYIYKSKFTFSRFKNSYLELLDNL